MMKLPKAYAKSVRKQSIDMTLSVNPLGCSPRALQAVRKSTREAVSLYPDAEILTGSIAQKFNVSEDNILLGNGSEMLIKLVSQAFVRKGEIAAVEEGSFFLFSKEPLISGGRIRFITVGSVKKMKQRPAILFIANPTTPGGIDRSDEALCATIDAIDPKIAVIDEANAEFRSGTMITRLRTSKNLIILRTFSKAFGLAGLRIGIAFGNADLIETMNEYIQPFPLTAPALAAAGAALADDEFIRKTRRFVAEERAFLTKALTKRGFSVSPSVTNNLFVSRSDNAAVVKALEQNGVSVIDGTFFPGNKIPGFRISLKDRQTNRLFLQKLDEALACVTQYNLLPSKEVL